MARQKTKRIARSTIDGLIRDYAESNPELVEQTQKNIRAGLIVVVEDK